MRGRVAKLASALCLLAACASAEEHVLGDPAAGEKVFRKCMACHQVGEDAKNRVGPTLNGIVGARMAQVEGFKYSPALIALGEEGMVWTPEELASFLEKPRTWSPGVKMAFAGLRKEEERRDVIAYLSGFREDGSAR